MRPLRQAAPVHGDANDEPKGNKSAAKLMVILFALDVAGRQAPANRIQASGRPGKRVAERAGSGAATGGCRPRVRINHLVGKICLFVCIGANQFARHRAQINYARRQRECKSGAHLRPRAGSGSARRAAGRRLNWRNAWPAGANQFCLIELSPAKTNWPTSQANWSGRVRASRRVCASKRRAAGAELEPARRRRAWRHACRATTPTA